MNILKTIKENDTMFDLINNIRSNIMFYIKNRDFLCDIGYSDEYLYSYIEELNIMINQYSNNNVQNWFKYYNAYLFMSSSFPYINPYLEFCFSFKDFVDIHISLKKTFEINEKKYMFNSVISVNSSNIIAEFIDLSLNENTVFSIDKSEWKKIKNNIVDEK